MICTGNHECNNLGDPIVVNITVKTRSCSGCSSGNVEQGLKVQLTGLLGSPECETDNLDNPEHKDYSSGTTSIFDNESGLGGCEVSACLENIVYVIWKLRFISQIDLYQSVDSGSASWTGPGTWTPEPEDTVCVDFFGDSNPTCCCSLGQALTSDDGFKPFSNCACRSEK